MIHKILAINPGSTSTKIAVYHNIKPVFLKNIQHPKEKLQKFTKVTDQFEYRKESILNELTNANIQIDIIQAVVGRGGLVRPIESGVYTINERLKKDLINGVSGEHASNLGALIADEIAKSIKGAKAFIADPAVVDELQDVARITGHPSFKKQSIFHALNHKATARSYAKLLNRKYEDLNLIIAHLGGGITVGAHRRGKVVDVNQGLDGDGPFSPERTGTLPAGALARYCINSKPNNTDLQQMLTKEGGLYAYLKTNSAYEVEIRATEGDKYAKLIQDAMSYQIAKEIGAMATVLHGIVDAIILTGGIAHNTMVVEYIKKMVRFIAPVVIYPGEDEMHSLAMNGLLVLKGEIKCKEYNKTTMVKDHLSDYKENYTDNM